MKIKKYTIQVTRALYSTRDIEVEAASPAKAEQLALDIAPDQLWQERDIVDTEYFIADN